MEDRSRVDASPGSPGPAAPPKGRAAPDAPRLVLASASPRRRKLLAEAGLDFEVRPAHLDETVRPGETPEALVERLAAEKAVAVAGALGAAAAGRVVLGSDTVVVLEGAILGKPRDPAHALELLTRLAGRTHRVLTGVARVADGCTRRLHVESRVTLHAASEEVLRAYVATGEPLDKAGAYAYQGEGRRLVAALEGSASNVIGLPLEETLALLAEADVHPEAPQGSDGGAPR